MGGLLVASGGGIADVAEAFAAQDRSRLHDHASAQRCAGIDGDVRIDAAAVSDFYVVSDYCAGAHSCFVADLYSFAEYGSRPDGCVLADPGGRRDDGGGVNGAILLRVTEQSCSAREGQAGLGRDQDGLGGSTGWKLSGNNGSGG